jgi:hypothetical protein
VKQLFAVLLSMTLATSLVASESENQAAAAHDRKHGAHVVPLLHSLAARVVEQTSGSGVCPGRPENRATLRSAADSKLPGGVREGLALR